LVSLAIADSSYPSLGSVTGDETKSVRDTALWFPDVPGSHLHFNERCFTGIDTPVSQFQPLYYILFAGSGINHEQRLTKISALFQERLVMMIDFHFDIGDVRRLGHQHQDLSEYQVCDFSIDGANEEVPETIEVDIDLSLVGSEHVVCFWKYGRLRSFMVKYFYIYHMVHY
jgi:hypothetical protein